MSRAQSIACSILNMSKADFEELMTPVDSQRRDDENCKRSEDTKADREWKNKVEEIAQEQVWVMCYGNSCASKHSLHLGCFSIRKRKKLILNCVGILSTSKYDINTDGILMSYHN